MGSKPVSMPTWRTRSWKRDSTVSSIRLRSFLDSWKKLMDLSPIDLLKLLLQRLPLISLKHVSRPTWAKTIKIMNLKAVNFLTYLSTSSLRSSLRKSREKIGLKSWLNVEFVVSLPCIFFSFILGIMARTTIYLYYKGFFFTVQGLCRDLICFTGYCFQFLIVSLLDKLAFCLCNVTDYDYTK